MSRLYKQNSSITTDGANRKLVNHQYLPPSYRNSNSESKRCFNCVRYENGWCSLYDAQVHEEAVCNKFLYPVRGKIWKSKKRQNVSVYDKTYLKKKTMPFSQKYGYSPSDKNGPKEKLKRLHNKKNRLISQRTSQMIDVTGVPISKSFLINNRFSKKFSDASGKYYNVNHSMWDKYGGWIHIHSNGIICMGKGHGNSNMSDTNMVLYLN